MFNKFIPRDEYYSINEPIYGVLVNGNRKFYDSIDAAYHASQQNRGMPFMRSGYDSRLIENVNGKVVARRDFKRAYK